MLRLAAAGLILLAPAALTAQTLRDFSTSRQLHGESRLAARVDYGAGTLRLAPGAERDLYRVSMSYDPERYLPLSEFDAGTGSVRLGLASAGSGGFHIGARRQLDQTAYITLSPAVALDLALQLGAAEADLELGWLQLSSLRMTTGASRTT